MRKAFCATLFAAGLLVMAPASPASAHQGLRSCGEATLNFVVPLAQSGQFGVAVSALALEGGVGDEVAVNHAALCEPA